MANNPTRYGAWPSPVSSDLLTTDTVTFDEIRLLGGATYWIEKRPSEQGRCVILKHRDGFTSDILPEPFSARSRVHEYGGGVYCLAETGIYFVNDADQNIYYLEQGHPPEAITRTKNACYADLVFDEIHQQLLCIMQQSGETPKQTINSLVTIKPANGKCHTLHSGSDFYSSPRLSPDGSRLSWLSWNHPDMPWDNTQLWLADTDGTHLSNPRLIAPSRRNSISVFQPEWASDNTLYFVADETGWWNLYRHTDNNTEQLTDLRQEFGRPQWVFSQSAYAVIDGTHLLCAPIENGITRLFVLDTTDKTLKPVDLPYNSYSSLQSTPDTSWFIAASATSFPALVSLNNLTFEHEQLSYSCHSSLDRKYFSSGTTLEFTGRHGDTVYAIYYQPVNPDVVTDPEDKPPLIVLTHGGPTAMCETFLDLRKQFWTTRGFAILDVNYSGSTGFGRAYRERLNNQWGIRDAEDCCDAALHLVSLGMADQHRLIIKGSSAGGYTVLCALAFHNVFSAGASYYGIGNLESLLTDTHKFESHYLDRLVGPYPEKKRIYQDRAPVNNIEKLKKPVIFFQGTDDKVVPMQQAKSMYTALKNSGVPVTCIYFPEEQHGFRKAETIQTAIDTEYAFYSRIFNLGAENTLPIHIDNFD